MRACEGDTLTRQHPASHMHESEYKQMMIPGQKISVGLVCEGARLSQFSNPWPALQLRLPLEDRHVIEC